MPTQVITAAASNATFTPNDASGDITATLTFLTGTDLKILVGADSTGTSDTITSGATPQVMTLGRDSSKQLNYSSAGGATFRISW